MSIDSQEGPHAQRPRRSQAGYICAVILVLAAPALLGCASSPGSDEDAERNLRIAKARRDVGIDYLSNGRTPLAIRELQHSLALNPDDPTTLHGLGEAYRRRGLLDKARETLLRALELDPSAQQVRLNLSGLYLQLRRFSDAAAQAQILIDDPTYEQPWYAYTNRGWAEFQLGYVQQARASFEEALAFRPNYWPARLNLGILETQQGHHMAAIANFERVLEREPGKGATSETNYRLGEVYVSLGRREKALQHFRAAAEGAPEGRWGKQSEEYLKLLH